MELKDITKGIFEQYRLKLFSEIEKANNLLNIKRISDSGKVIEIALKNFLKMLLPDYVGITRGHIFSSDCKETSKEIDLILFDRRYFNGFIIEDDVSDSVSLISIDTVIGIISVKKTLTINSLKDAIENLNSVFSLQRDKNTNRFHYDLEFDESIEYMSGEVVNNIFSCIVSFENEAIFGKDKNYSKESVEKQMLDIAQKNILDNLLVDLIFTLDGFISFPLDFKTKGWTKTFETKFLGAEKTILENQTLEDIKEKELLTIGYSYNGNEPELLLGMYIAYIQHYCTQLVKKSPNSKYLFENFLKNPISLVRKK